MKAIQLFNIQQIKSNINFNNGKLNGVHFRDLMTFQVY